MLSKIDIKYNIVLLKRTVFTGYELQASLLLLACG